MMLPERLLDKGANFFPSMVTCTWKSDNWTLTSSSLASSGRAYLIVSLHMSWVHCTSPSTPPGGSASNFRRHQTLIFWPSGAGSLSSESGKCRVTNLAAPSSFETMGSMTAFVSCTLYAPLFCKRRRASSNAWTFRSPSALPSSSNAPRAAAREAVTGGSSPRLVCACAMTVCRAACSRKRSSFPLCARSTARASCAARSASSTRSLRRCSTEATRSIAACPFQSPDSLMRAQARLAACMAPSSSHMARFARISLCSAAAIFSPSPRFLAADSSTLAFFRIVSDLPRIMEAATVASHASHAPARSPASWKSPRACSASFSASSALSLTRLNCARLVRVEACLAWSLTSLYMAKASFSACGTSSSLLLRILAMAN
mmetsp:Transcript_150536/g.419483  ORF Transcript_150536/g.419483 Transcript_150536/m.419483 type:complete len:374 (+) Transcript_150536:1332-2453(+)